MATVIDIRTRQSFETAPAVPAFCDWLSEQLGSPRWFVVKRRDYKRGWRGLPHTEGTVLILNREYDAYRAEYDAAFGFDPVVPARRR